MIIDLWPILTFICLLIYKRILIPYTPPYKLNILGDLILLIIMVVLSIRRNARIAKFIQGAIALYIIFFTWLDLCIYLALYNRLTFDNFTANYSYLYLIPQFISKPIILLTIGLLLGLLVFSRLSIRLRWNASLFNYFCYVFLVGSVIAYTYLSDKRLNMVSGEAYDLSTHSLVDTEVNAKTRTFVENADPDFNQRVKKLLNGDQWQEGPNKDSIHPNIILLLSESLSGVDSKYSGGLYDRMPKIDQVLKEGMVMKHMYANGGISAQGLAALILGVQTSKTHGVTEMIKFFPPASLSGNNLVKFAKAAGYRTIALTVNPPSWSGVSDWLSQVGFDEVYDRGSAIFDGYPVYTWSAPSDEAMFTEALKLIARQTGPYLLLIETLSLHLPYILPQPEKYTISSSILENQIHYIDETTNAFYQTLKKDNFFDKGFLVLVGDHRRFEPLDSDEIRDGGFVAWGGKIVGGIIGQSIPPNSQSTVPFTLRDMNILLHHFINGQTTVAQQELVEANLSSQLGIDTLLAVSLTTQDDNGTYLIRDERYRALMISIFGNVPFDQIPYPFYKNAVSYLVLNELWLGDQVRLAKTPVSVSG